MIFELALVANHPPDVACDNRRDDGIRDRRQELIDELIVRFEHHAQVRQHADPQQRA